MWTIGVQPAPFDIGVWGQAKRNALRAVHQG